MASRLPALKTRSASQPEEKLRQATAGGGRGVAAQGNDEIFGIMVKRRPESGRRGCVEADADAQRPGTAAASGVAKAHGATLCGNMGMHIQLLYIFMQGGVGHSQPS